ncbi:hypothetical protein [Acidihalobacter aeolianus]|uniref:hypothetical protein n=1 Tax=Acidihalobacter aeolianus TaxID=2792603 RepID=UPI0012EA1934|nr:hypothetical protein [Acidihalobacter aeolianus]
MNRAQATLEALHLKGQYPARLVGIAGKLDQWRAFTAKSPAGVRKYKRQGYEVLLISTAPKADPVPSTVVLRQRNHWIQRNPK